MMLIIKEIKKQTIVFHVNVCLSSLNGMLLWADLLYEGGDTKLRDLQLIKQQVLVNQIRLIEACDTHLQRST